MNATSTDGEGVNTYSITANNSKYVLRIRDNGDLVVATDGELSDVRHFNCPCSS